MTSHHVTPGLIQREGEGQSEELECLRWAGLDSRQGEQQEQGHPGAAMPRMAVTAPANKLVTKLPVPSVRGPSGRWGCLHQSEVHPGEQPGPAAQLRRVLTTQTGA